MKTKIKVYTDGACSGNPGPGGYGTLWLIPGIEKPFEYSQGFKRTTNNRMELQAVITGLYGLREYDPTQIQVEVYSDSKYVCDAINKNWIKVVI